MEEKQEKRLGSGLRGERQTGEGGALEVREESASRARASPTTPNAEARSTKTTRTEN